MTLQEEISEVLRASGHTSLSLEQITALINEKRLYTRQNGSPFDPWQVAAIVVEHPEIFEVLIKLRR